MPDRRISLDEAEQIGRALMPAFAEVVAGKIDELEEKLEVKYDLRLAALEGRMKDQEGFRGRIAIVYAAISAVVLIVWGAVSEWVKSKLVQKP